jgi:hypothetical protein
VPFCFSWQVSTSLPANFSDANDDDDDEYLNILVEDGWANDDEDDDYYYYEDEYGLAPAAAGGSSSGSGSSSSRRAAGRDPTAVAAAQIRQQVNTPAFQIWLKQQQQLRAAEEARAAEIKQKQDAAAAAAAAAAPAFDKQQQRQQAVMLAQQVAQLQQQQLRPLHRPAVSPNLRSPAASNMSNDAADDFEELDPMAVRKSDIGLTPAEMAALLEYANDQQDQGSGFRKPVSAPVLNPRLGYSFSSMGRQAAASLAAAVATGQLKDPLLLRPPVKPGGSPGMFLLYNFENIHKIYIYLITNMYTCITVIYCETSLLLAGFPGSESCHDSENHICKVH